MIIFAKEVIQKTLEQLWALFVWIQYANSFIEPLLGRKYIFLPTLLSVRNWLSI